jgi:hypothetical protein
MISKSRPSIKSIGDLFCCFPQFGKMLVFFDLFHKNVLTNYMSRVDFALKDMFAKVLPFDFVMRDNQQKV